MRMSLSSPFASALASAAVSASAESTQKVAAFASTANKAANASSAGARREPCVFMSDLRLDECEPPFTLERCDVRTSDTEEHPRRYRRILQRFASADGAVMPRLPLVALALSLTVAANAGDRITGKDFATRS